MELPGLAELTTLMVIVTLAPSLALAENVVIDCSTETGEVKGDAVTQKDTLVTVKCKEDADVFPTPDSNNLKSVYKNSACVDTQQLDVICPQATATVATDQGFKLVKIDIKKLPDTDRTFYVKCEKGGTDACKAAVTVKAPQATGGGGVTDEGASGGTGAGSGQQPGGTTSVQICKQANRSITVEIPEKGSSAQFACDTSFTLYPSAADKIFSADCKKQETLKNMARSEATGDKSQTIFTLTANKKPAKKKLCYLCAKAGVSESKPGKAEDYCMIYVESSVRTPFGPGSTLALMLPCVLAALHFT